MDLKKEISTRGGILIIAIVIIILATIAIIVTKNNNAKKSDAELSIITNQNKDNYILTEGTSKLNTSETLVADKKVGNILIQNSKLIYDGKSSNLTAKVTNDSLAKDNLRLKVKFIANDGSTISETVALVGKVASNEAKYISAGITKDVTNAKDVTYEIVE